MTETLTYGYSSKKIQKCETIQKNYDPCTSTTTTTTTAAAATAATTTTAADTATATRTRVASALEALSTKTIDVVTPRIGNCLALLQVCATSQWLFH